MVSPMFGNKTSIEKIADEESFAMRKEKKNHRSNGVTYLPAGGFHKANENSLSQLTWKAMGSTPNVRQRHP